MAVDVGQFEMFGTYPKVVGFVMRTYAADEVLAETRTDVITLLQDSNMTEKSHSNHLWNRALLCDSVFPDPRLNSLFVEGLFPATCTQVRVYLATHTNTDYRSVARYTQALGSTSRSARR